SRWAAGSLRNRRRTGPCYRRNPESWEIEPMDKTLLKGLMVLEAVTDPGNRPRTIEDLAARVGLTRSNTHRTLQTLIHAGYVAKDEEAGGYRGSIRLFELAARELGRLDVRKVAAPAMLRLADGTGETVHLSVLDGLD